MSDILQFGLLGVGAGAIYALLGQGLVLIYRGSGVLNLAHGAFAMAGAYIYYELNQLHGYGKLVSILLSVALMAIVGVLTDQLLMRALRRGSALARLIGTMGLLLVIQSIGILRYGTTATHVKPISKPTQVEVFGATVTSDRLWLLLIASVLTVALILISRYSRVGWAMEAVAENQRSAAALGWSPELVSAATWGLGAALAAIAGILIAPITQLTVTNLSLLVIPALAASLLGGFTSFGLTLVGGLIVGIAQSEVNRFVDLTGAAACVPFVVVVLVLVFRGSALPLRGYMSEKLPSVGTGRTRGIVAIPLLAISLLGTVLLNDDWTYATITCLSVATILLSLVVLTGYAGQLSLAQYSLAGIGALITARLVSAYNLPFVVAFVLGVFGTVLVGLVFALPALRTRGVQLAVVTLCLGVAAQDMLFNNSSVIGSAAGTNVGSPSLFGLNIDAFEYPVRYTCLVIVAFALCATAVANLRRSVSGRKLLAVRTNERAAAALGINVVAAKLYAFAVAGALAGVGGILLAFQASTVVYSAFGPLASINAVAESVIGGIGYVFGAPVGALLAPGSVGQMVSGDGAESAKYLPLIGGIALLVLLVLDANGLVHRVLRIVPVFGTKFGKKQFPVSVETEPSNVSRVSPKGLTVDELTIKYGGTTAVDGIDFEIAPGEVLGVIGPNGAGKTSVIDGISGFTRASGRVLLAGKDVSAWSPHRRSEAGLVRSFQSLELFEDMTVLENLQTANDEKSVLGLITDLVRPKSAPLRPMAAAAVRRFGLTEFLDRKPSELSYGQRRLVAIARSVASEPSVLLLDEPVAGIDEAESREFAQLVKKLAKDWGIAVLVIEHDMEFVMTICDRIVVIDFGKKVAAGTPAQIRTDAAALAAYLGEEPARSSELEGTQS